MYRASAGIMLPTSIIGSLPRPFWYTASLGRKSLVEATVGIENGQILDGERRLDRAARHA